MTSSDNCSLEAAALQHWASSLASRHGSDMIANPVDLDLEAACFDEFFNDSDKASTTRYFWDLARKARHAASLEDQYGAYLELLELGYATEACMIALRARRMVAAAPFPLQSAWG